MSPSSSRTRQSQWKILVARKFNHTPKPVWILSFYLNFCEPNRSWLGIRRGHTAGNCFDWRAKFSLIWNSQRSLLVKIRRLLLNWLYAIKGTLARHSKIVSKTRVCKLLCNKPSVAEKVEKLVPEAWCNSVREYGE